MEINRLTPEELEKLSLETKEEAVKAEDPNKIEDELLAAELDALGVNLGLSDAPETEDPPAVKADPETAEEEEETPEAVPLDERIKEFEVPEKPEEPTLRDKLTAFQADLQREAMELQQDFLAGLPDLRTADGRKIYDLDQKAINDYIVQLQDEAKAFEAGQVQANYFKALEAATNYRNKFQGFETKRAQYREASDHVDWVEIKDEVAKKLPELTQDDFNQVGAYIDQKATTDPAYYAALSTKAGKLQKGIEALNTLGIIGKLKEVRKTTEPPQDEVPSAPDAGLVSKKVKTKTSEKNNNYDAVAKSSLKEFKKIPQADIDAALEAEMAPLLQRLGF